jgi:hypothetical protein
MVTKTSVRVGSSIAAAIFSVAVLTAAPPAAASGLIYVNRCAGGCTVKKGLDDDAINGVSSIPTSGTSNLSEFAHGDLAFSETVSCLRSLFARYDVDIVTANPGDVARRELMLAGTASQVQLPTGVYGEAPHYGMITDNAIAFAFANDIFADANNLCWIAAQQLSFLYGLEVEFYCSDITTVSQDHCGLKSFSDFDAPCGAFSALSTCPFSGQPTQNSAALLALRAGLSDRIFLNEFEQPRPAP